MPVTIGPVESDGAVPEDVQALLFKDDGETLTLEGEIIRDFLDGVDFDPIFDDPEVRESGLVKGAEAFCIEKDGELEPAKEGDEGAEPCPVETIEPDALIQIVDVEDILAMFEWHVENELPSEGREDKARLAAARQLLGLDVDEAKGPFAKGEFKKIRKRGKKGLDAVTRMLLAMIHKSSIQRVAKGKGYKKGDYKKHPAGYAGGTPSGIKKWKKYKGKFAAKIQRAAKKAKMTGGAKKKAAAKKGAAKKLAKKGAQAGKRQVAASEKPAPARRRLLEGASLAGAVAAKVNERSAQSEAKTD